MKKLFIILMVIGLIFLGWIGWKKINQPTWNECPVDKNGHCIDKYSKCNLIWNPKTNTFDKPSGC